MRGGVHTLQRFVYTRYHPLDPSTVRSYTQDCIPKLVHVCSCTHKVIIQDERYAQHKHPYFTAHSYFYLLVSYTLGRLIHNNLSM